MIVVLILLIKSIFYIGVQKTSGSPIKSPKSPKSPRKKKVEYKGDDNLAENMIDSFGRGLMACTELQRDNMVCDKLSICIIKLKS